MNLRVKHVRGAKTERIDRAVRNLHGSDKGRIHRRFHPLGLLRINHLGVDPGRKASLHESVLIGQIILRKGYEQS